MEIVWKDRKRPFLGLPLSFTVYKLDAEKLFVKTGMLNLVEDEVRLYRIKDITLKQTFGQRILGIGTLHCCSNDATLREFDIKHIKQPRYVRDLLSKMVEEERLKKRVRNLEHMDDGAELDDEGVDTDLHE